MKKALLALAMCSAFLSSGYSQIQWDGDIDNNWFTNNGSVTNWSVNVLPAAADDVLIGFDMVDFDAASSTVRSLNVGGNTTGDTPFLNLTDGASLIVTTDVLVGGAAGLTGQLDLTTSVSGNQTVLQSSTLTVGRGVGSNGTVNVNGGVVALSGNLNVGDAGGTGFFSAALGGNSTRSDVSANRVNVGRNANSAGTVTLQHTDFQAGGVVVGFGSNSTGIMTTEEVDATTGNVNVGFSPGSVGSLTTAETAWTLTGFLRIGNDGIGSVTFGDNSHVAVTTSGTSSSVMIGQNAGSTGFLEVSSSGAGNSSLTTNHQITVGYAGNGELNIGGNAVVTSGPGTSPTNSAMIVANLAAEGILNISERARYESATGSNVIMGYVGNATATIDSGGSLKATDMQVAREASSTSNVLVTGGNGSLVELDRALYIGGSDTAQGGKAKVEVIDGAKMLVGEKIQLWKSDSTISVVSSNSSVAGGAVGIGMVNQALLSSGDLSVFQDGMLQGSGTLEGSLTVYSGGVVAPGNSPGILTVTQATQLEVGGILDLEIGGEIVGTEFDQLVTDTFEGNGGTIRVTLLGMYAPGFGDSFQIVDANSITLAGLLFDFTNATLGAGLSWETGSFGVDGTISVIPEPSVVSLIGLGSLLIFRRRRSA